MKAMKATYILLTLLLAFCALAVELHPVPYAVFGSGKAGDIPYIMHLLCYGIALLASYFAIRSRRARPIVRMVVVAAAANMVVLLRLLFGIEIQYYMLAILFVSYLFIWRDIRNVQV